MELAGRNAVVIGTGGIGRGIALGLAAEGMSVGVADIDPAAADAVAAEIAAAGGRAVPAQADATSRISLDDLATRMVTELGGVNVLVNTVGVILDRRLDAATDEDWQWFLEFNVMATVRSVAAFLPHLRSSGDEAHIVVTSSMAGLLALPPKMVGGIYNGLYTTTKHALIGYADMLRAELEPERIGVSVLCPGLVAGNLSGTSARNRPAQYGGPMPAPERRAPSAMPGAMPGDEVGPIVARGIKGNRFYIFTHPESSAELVEQRHQGVVDDFAFYRRAD